ncbi:hypothetical protein E2562_026351 [Oryza meyeriana var. granulata]|uniref:Uncharacterized protein n=1 Tax=Oryza meyeriana var. granulata TaxID=110450 RepID=A0A6G1EZ12_9ORYZ|nr:hypothetical protein E2562_026351 [Oryza meyeriana var. granulata]
MVAAVERTAVAAGSAATTWARTGWTSSTGCSLCSACSTCSATCSVRGDTTPAPTAWTPRRGQRPASGVTRTEVLLVLPGVEDGRRVGLRSGRFPD